MKKEKIKKKMGKNLFIWIRSFLLTLILISGVLILLTNWMVRSFSNEIMNLNHRIAANIQTSIDIRLNDIDNFMAQLPLNADNLYLSKIEKAEEVDVKRMIQMSSRLNDYKVSNTFIGDICIYYPKLDYIVGDLGYFPARQYYMLAHENKDTEYKNWLKTITSEEKNGYHFQMDADEDLQLHYTKWLPYDNSDEKSAILHLSINKEEMEHMLKNDKYASGHSINAVMGQQGNLYAFSGSKDEKMWLEEILQENAGKQYIEVEKYSGAIQDSDFYPLNYITLYDRKELLKNSYFVRNIAYLSLGICMILGITLFWILGRRNNRPLKNILEKLYVVREDREGQDEYALIQSRIDTMLENDLTSQKKLQEQRNAMEGMFLHYLLSSEEKNNSVIFAAMQRFHLQLEYSLFQIMVLRSKIGFSEENIKDVIGKIKRQIEELQKELYVIATEFKGDIVFLFHMEEEVQDLQEVIAKNILTAGKEAQSSVQLSVGEVYDTTSNVILSYQQAFMMLDTTKNTENQIIKFEDYRQPAVKEEKLESGIMAEYEMAVLEGNYENVQKQIDRLFNQYVGNDHNIFTARSKKYAVINSAIEALNRTPELENQKAEYILALQNARDNQTLLEVIHEIFQALEESQKKRQKSRKEGCTEWAKSYIDQHFEDPMIGLYSIAEMLGISNSYLSTSFKKQYGLGIVQYINQLRIEKAKKMILNTDYSIKEIAFRVGFASDMTFIRVFKQFENVTPGKYKKEGPAESEL